MSIPSVELRFNPTDLRPRDLPTFGTFLGHPADAIDAGLAVVRARMVAQMKAEVRGLADPTHVKLMLLADVAWQLLMPTYRRISAPVMADAYLRAFRAADAGDVPASVIHDLAEKHAEKIGEYFHASSRDALADGFNAMVNRRIPAKAAADKVLDAYGLTPRQMRGYTNNKQLVVPVDSPSPLDVKAKTREYIDKSFTQRTRKLSAQEEHNIDEQAKQLAWMWMQEKGRLTERAQKMWITAHDERVCPICGPLHGQKVLVGEQFKTNEGNFWSPGLHPNCRCVVRLIENRFQLEKRQPTGHLVRVSKADDDWNPKLHPRGGDPENPGRFSRVAERRSGPVIRTTEDDVIETAPPPVNVLPSVLANIRSAVPPPIVNVQPQANVKPPVNVETPPVNVETPVVNVASNPVNVMNVSTKPTNILGLLPATRTSPETVAVQVPQTTPSKPKRKLTQYQEIRPLDEPYYAVVSGDPRFHQFDKEVFSADRDQVILDAAEIRDQAIESIMRQHVVGGQVKFREMHSSYGIPLEARIEEEEFRNILEVLAQHTTSEPPHDALIDVDYYDPDGYETDPPIETQGRTVLDIAHAIGVDSDHLTVHVAKLDAVHSENVGKGHAHRQQIVGHPYDEYEVTGDYAVNDYAPEYEEGTGTPVGMDIYSIDPHDPAIGYMEEES